ncbi:MAG: hypothetical protein PHE83_11525 [Opitutaceae bacterium]|nr:hypothetical protein [Opitutaceae bacterium]
MEWILDHVQVLFAIAIAVVAILQKLRRSRAEGTTDEAPAVDPQEAERTRRIQEEIRRRIMERRGLAPAAPAPPEAAEEAPEILPPPMVEEGRPFVLEPPLPVMEVTAVPDRAAELVRQQQMLQQLRESESARPKRPAVVTATDGSPASAPENGLPADLRRPAGLRRAVILREILGPPVGLQ